MQVQAFDFSWLYAKLHLTWLRQCYCMYVMIHGDPMMLQLGWLWVGSAPRPPWSTERRRASSTGRPGLPRTTWSSSFCGRRTILPGLGMDNNVGAMSYLLLAIDGAHSCMALVTLMMLAAAILEQTLVAAAKVQIVSSA